MRAQKGEGRRRVRVSHALMPCDELQGVVDEKPEGQHDQANGAQNQLRGFNAGKLLQAIPELTENVRKRGCSVADDKDCDGLAGPEHQAIL
mmetsp:Transcript_3990/g.4625  ORF Transcript_3990/g.4625 Transcript_3990/m.4625 type:complete len:91 (-) Transcript_3990:21-293(-)